MPRSPVASSYWSRFTTRFAPSGNPGKRSNRPTTRKLCRVSRFVPGARMISTVSPTSTWRSSAVSESTSSPSGVGLEGRQRVGARAIDEERVRERRDLRERRGIDRRQVHAVLVEGPDQHGVLEPEHHRGHRRHTRDRRVRTRSSPEEEGAQRAGGDAEVRADDEPGVGHLRGVVGGGEDGQAHPEGHDQPEAKDPGGERPGSPSQAAPQDPADDRTEPRGRGPRQP